MKDTFLLVDGNSLMHRAFHALPLMDADGIYTNAIYGFLSMLLKVIREENVQYLAVCFDEHGPTFRHTVYADYKAGRKATPPELRQQFDTILTLLDDLGIRRFSLQGWEADDLLGTLSLKGAEAGAAPLLLTGDRDALQLVGGGTELMFTRKGISETVRFNASKVYEEYGFTPEQVTDWKGLAGDSSDNIPGVPGVGDKTAVKLLQEYGNLEAVLENANQVKGKLGEKLVTYAEQARFSKELATIRRDAPVDFSLGACALPDLKKGIPALEKLKLNSIIRRLGSEGESGETGNKESLALLPFDAPAALTAPEEISAWLKATEDAGPLCLFVSELLPAGKRAAKGQRCRAQRQGAAALAGPAGSSAAGGLRLGYDAGSLPAESAGEELPSGGPVPGPAGGRGDAVLPGGVAEGAGGSGRHDGPDEGSRAAAELCPVPDGAGRLYRGHGFPAGTG